MLNVTRYITFRTAAASLSALAISLVLGPWMIRKLREFQIGQVIRQEGPQIASRQGRHADDGRAADPDGGARADAAVGGPDERLRLDRGARRRPAFGAIGFADDYLKIVRRSHHGLRPRYKMGWQIVDRRSASASRCSCSRTTGSTTRG